MRRPRPRLRLIWLMCASNARAQDLAGLWQAKARFGPDSGGPLLIEKEGAAFFADIRGRRLPVRLEAGELTFELPGRLGQFRGRFRTHHLSSSSWDRRMPLRRSKLRIHRLATNSFALRSINKPR